jgi:hypothetical protein
MEGEITQDLAGGGMIRIEVPVEERDAFHKTRLLTKLAEGEDVCAELTSIG